MKNINVKKPTKHRLQLDSEDEEIEALCAESIGTAPDLCTPFSR